MEFTTKTSGRLDAIIAEYAQISRTEAKQYIEDGVVRLHQKKVTKPSTLVEPGDSITITIARVIPDTTSYPPIDSGLEVLFEDEDVLVINKPAGLICHHGARTQSKVTLLHGLHFLFNKKKLPFDPEHCLVHRLDKETTGCILAAKHKAAHLFLQSQFKSRTIKKYYLAIVEGVPKEPEALIDAPIGRSVHNRTQMSVTMQTRHRSSTTRYKVLAKTTGNTASLLRFDLLTGRTHQIRVHCKAIGHPLLYDTKYGSLHFESSTFFLHAYSITWQAVGGTTHTIAAPLPVEFCTQCSTLGITIPVEYTQL